MDYVKGFDGRYYKRGFNTWRWTMRLIGGSVLLFVVAVVVFCLLVRSEPAAYRAHKVYMSETGDVKRREVAESLRTKMSDVFLRDVDAKTEQNPVIRDAVAAHPSRQAGNQQPVQVKEVSANVTMREIDHVLQHRDESSFVVESINEPIADRRVDRVERIKLTHRQINLLVEEQLEDWFTTRGYVMPSEVRNPMITVSDERVAITFDYVDTHVTQNFTLHLRYKFLNNGLAKLELVSVDAGRAPLPAKKATRIAKVSGLYEDSIRKIETWFAELENIEIKPVLEIEHRRRVRVEGVRVVSGGVELTFRVQDHQTYRETNDILAMR